MRQTMNGTNIIKFINFRDLASGRLVTSGNGLIVAYSRNPYGTHSLVLIDKESLEAIRHGLEAVMVSVYKWMPQRQYRRLRQFLAARGIATDWALSG